MTVHLLMRRATGLWQKARTYHLTPSRLSSWALSRYSFLTASRRSLGLPRVLWIEPTNSCNLQCALCPTGSRTLGRPTASLGLGQFQMLMDELHRTMMRVVFSGYGEPLLNPQISQMVAYAHARGIFSEMYSNLLAAHDDSLRGLIEARLDLLVVAVDLAPEGQNWRYVSSTAHCISLVRERLGRLAQLKDSLHSKLPVVRVSYPVTKDSLQFLESARQLANEVKAEFLPKTVNAIVAGKSESEMREKYIPAGFDRYTRARTGSGYCHWPYAGGLIYANGDYVPCCYLARGEHILGNVFEQRGVQNVWNSPEFQGFRYRLMHEPQSVPHCAECVERFDAL